MTYIKKITKKEAIETLRKMGLTKFSKDWKHSKPYYKIECTWADQRTNDFKSEFKRLINFSDKHRFEWADKTSKTATGYTRIIGMHLPIQPKPKIYPCAKCGDKFLIEQLSKNTTDKNNDVLLLCHDCQKLWVDAIFKYQQRWLKGQGEAFIFR